MRTFKSFSRFVVSFDVQIKMDSSFTFEHHCVEESNIILNKNSFQLNGENYLQTHGTAMGTEMAASFANIFIVKTETTLIQQSKTKLKNQRPVTHLLSQNSPLSKMVDCYKREAWALSTRFLRRKLISTEEALFYGGS